MEMEFIYSHKAFLVNPKLAISLAISVVMLVKHS